MVEALDHDKTFCLFCQYMKNMVREEDVFVAFEVRERNPNCVISSQVKKTCQ